MNKIELEINCSEEKLNEIVKLLLEATKSNETVSLVVTQKVA